MTEYFTIDNLLSMSHFQALIIKPRPPILRKKIEDGKNNANFKGKIQFYSHSSVNKQGAYLSSSSNMEGLEPEPLKPVTWQLHC